jgi:cell division protein ZipA
MTVYALDADTGRWTFLISADGPKQVTRLKMAWAYLNPIDEDPEIPSPQVFSGRRDAVLTAIRPLGEPTWEVSLPPERATGRARWLRDFKRRHDYSPTLVLRAPEGGVFEGRAAWDVMLCLGLRWGDMDIFHWANPTGVGDDTFFSVWTTTPPGYFLPERIAAGRVRVRDLVFGFSAPRCARPAEVFDAMVRAVEYARKRLGGSVVDEAGGEADVDGMRRKLRSLEQEMKDHGLMPGGDSALHLF